MKHLVDEIIDHEAVIQSVLRRSDGAVAFFAGVVRDHHQGKSVQSIFYDAYRSMAEKELAKIVSQVEDAFPGVRVAAVHRLGLLIVGETSIAIACVSPHREEAFAACREVIELVKKTVPIWKKERSPDGEEWVGWQGEQPGMPLP